MSFSYKKIEKDFPFLRSGLAYLDNASTTQKPTQVIDAIDLFYSTYNANVHRGIYASSEKASLAYENVREKVRSLIHAQRKEEIIFTSGTTASINMLAQMLKKELQEGDEIILSPLEHHANLVPWQMIAKEKNLTLRFLPLTEQQTIDPKELDLLINEKTRILSITHIANSSGYVLPIKELIEKAKEKKIITILDAAQSVPHMEIDVQEINVDFLAFSAHKMCGPTGVGVLYGKFDRLNALQPVFGGGSMIETVTLQESTWTELPLRLEPGTPNIAGVIGFGEALEYLQSIGGMKVIEEYVSSLHAYAYDALSALEGVTIYGPAQSHCQSIISFTLDGIHPHDVASSLDQENIACRAGHHCAQPTMSLWNVPATVRISFYFYNTKEEIDRCIAAIQKTQQLFR